MSGPARWLRRRLLGISPDEATFARRGFADADPAARRRLEGIGRTFVRGYLAGLDDQSPALARRLDLVEADLRGFAYEGAAMALTLLDELTPWRRGRLRRLLDQADGRHVYMVHVGAGWALARLRRPVDSGLGRLDPLLGWLAVDGYGFHEGYFHSRRCVAARARPARLTGYARRAFDQGLGRSLWFVEGADPRRIGRTVGSFPPDRRADLWSGVGLAATYAGGANREGLELLVAAADGHRDQLAQGAAFAAEARSRAGNPTPDSELGCRVLTGVPSAEASAVARAARRDLPPDGAEPAYEFWRARTRAQLAREAVRC